MYYLIAAIKGCLINLLTKLAKINKPTKTIAFIRITLIGSEHLHFMSRLKQ